MWWQASLCGLSLVIVSLIAFWFLSDPVQYLQGLDAMSLSTERAALYLCAHITIVLAHLVG